MNPLIKIYKKFSKLVNRILPDKVRHKYAFIKWKIRTIFFRKKSLVEISVNDQRFLINIDPQNGYIDESIYLHRKWDVDVGECIASYLKKGDVFVDVGANIGYFSLFSSGIVGDKGIIYAFEPIDFLSKMCESSVKENGFKNISVINKACGEKKFKTKIFLKKHNIGASSLYQREVGSKVKDIEVTTLDDELSFVKSLDFIKIDAEGYEYEVLMGGVNLIKKFKPTMLVEFSPVLYNMRDPLISVRIIDLLDELGYETYFVRGSGFFEPTGEKIKLSWQDDILCLHKSKL